MSINEIIAQFSEISLHPSIKLSEYKKNGLKVIGVLPCHVPEEIIHACGAVPFGILGMEAKAVKAKEYFPSFFCSILTTSMEMLLSGMFDSLDGIVLTDLCDSLKSFSQNAMLSKKNINFIPLSLPINTVSIASKAYFESQMKVFSKKLSSITGINLTSERLKESIEKYNLNKKLLNDFLALTRNHSKTITSLVRASVIKACYFLTVEEANQLLCQLNAELEKLPNEKSGLKIAVTGILFDNPETLQMLDNNGITIVASQVLYETNKTDNPCSQTDLSGITERYFTLNSSLLGQRQFLRKASLDSLINRYHPEGVIFAMTKFCDPEEYDFPLIKKSIQNQDIPFVVLEMNKGSESLGKNQTIIDALGEMI
ncbi:MAG: 2-hydroxyacyl-CoA dehydratase family protein [Bacilli bacterium]